MNSSDEEISLIVRADDMGSLHSCNLAVMKAFEEGILTCAAILAPAPWARAAAEMASANPGWCIGAHLTVVGEWRGYPWRPVLPYDKVPTIVDDQGFLHRSPREFLEANPDYSEVEMELKAQIDLLKKRGVSLCYLDRHYIGGENDFTKVVRELAEEHSLPVSGLSDEKRMSGVYNEPPWAKEFLLRKQLEDLTPGLWLLVNHLLVESPDGKGLVHTEPTHVMRGGVGNHRAAELACLLSPRIKETVLHKRIRLVDYRNFKTG